MRVVKLKRIVSLHFFTWLCAIIVVIACASIGSMVRDFGVHTVPLWPSIVIGVVAQVVVAGALLKASASQVKGAMLNAFLLGSGFVWRSSLALRLCM